jgi:hypothetical protein
VVGLEEGKLQVISHEHQLIESAIDLLMNYFMNLWSKLKNTEQGSQVRSGRHALELGIGMLFVV